MNTYNQARQKEISAIQSIVELRQLDFNPITELPAILADARKFCKAKGVVITLFTSKKYWVKSSINFEESLFGKYFTEMISNEWHTAQDKAAQVFGVNLNMRFIAVPIFDANQCKIGAICFEEPNLKTISKSSDLYFKSLATSVELLFQKELMKCKYESSIDLLERNKQLLLKKENLIKYTHDFAPIGIVKTLLNGDIVSANNKFRSMISSTNQVEGMPWFLNAIEKEMLSIQWDECIKRKDKFSAICSYFQNDNSKCFLNIEASPIINLDGEIRYLLFVTDITNKVKEDEKNRRAEEVKQLAYEKKEAFLANMSHEIRSPMNAILGFADILNETLINKKQKEYINVIQSAGQNLLSVINNILDYSKSENGKVKIADKIIAWKDIERNVYTLLKKKADEKKIKFSFEMPNDLPSNLRGDIVLINQVLVNLVDNAIKFTDKGKVELMLNLKNDSSTSSSIEFIVKDSGIGLSQDVQQKIFERYFQVKDESRKDELGTGLGLNISKNLVHEMGGEINLISEIGKGSEFSFVLDLKKEIIEKKNITPLIKLTAKSASKLKILLFEDNELNKQLMQHIIRDFGFELDVAENGKVGTELLKKHTYDVVVMDLDMPIMDGYEATRKIRNQMKLNVPILAMTGHKIVGEKEKCLSIGMNDFISKPVNKSELFEKLADLTYNKLDSELSTNTAAALKIFDDKKSNYLKNLSNGDDSFEREMMKVFVTTIPEKIARLEIAINSKEIPSIQKLTHNIRGSVAIMGIPFAGEMLTEIDMLSINYRDFEKLILRFKDVENVIACYCEMYRGEVFKESKESVA